MNEPLSIVCGDRWSWTREESDYPTGDGWSLKYWFINAGGRFSITANGTAPATYGVDVAPAVSSQYPPGDYRWQAVMTKSTTDRVVIGTGSIRVVADYSAIEALDSRSDARQIYDALLGLYKSYSNGQGLVASYTIAGRTMTFKNSADLLREINHWKSVVAGEEAAERLAFGLGAGNRIMVRG